MFTNKMVSYQITARSQQSKIYLLFKELKNLLNILCFRSLEVYMGHQVIVNYSKDIILLIHRYTLMEGDMTKELQQIQKEGNCEKQSRFFKSWRSRWLVLTTNLLMTFKQRRVYQSPTEIIQLKEVVSIKTCDEEISRKNAFKIQTNETTFYFGCETSIEKEQWIGAIGKAMVKRNNQDMDD